LFDGWWSGFASPCFPNPSFFEFAGVLTSPFGPARPSVPLYPQWPCHSCHGAPFDVTCLSWTPVSSVTQCPFAPFPQLLRLAAVPLPVLETVNAGTRCKISQTRRNFGLRSGARHAVRRPPNRSIWLVKYVLTGVNDDSTHHIYPPRNHAVPRARRNRRRDGHIRPQSFDYTPISGQPANTESRSMN